MRAHEFLSPKLMFIQEHTESLPTTTLNDIYDGEFPDDDEMIWNFASDDDFSLEFPVRTMPASKIANILAIQYQVSELEDIFKLMSREQKAIVKSYRKNSAALQDTIIVMSGDVIVDGNHRALAAALTKLPIKYIDLIEEPLTEITHASGLPDTLKWTPSLHSASTIIGQTQGHDIYKTVVDNETVFAFLDDNKKLEAYIIVTPSIKYKDRVKITRVESFSNTTGMITIMMLWLRNNGLKFVIEEDEPLTRDGLAWLQRMIMSSKHTFKITNQHGDPVKPDDLEAERHESMTTNHGPTAIFIEFTEGSRNLLKETDEKWLNRTSILAPSHQFLGIPTLP